MKRRASHIWMAILAIILMLGAVGCGGKVSDQGKADAGKADKKAAAAPIVIGLPTALGSIEGQDAIKIVQMAVEEINARGGVNVKGEKHPLEVVSIDTREHEPGVPVNEALAALEKLISEKKPNAIVVGAFRSEVLLASMDLIAKYKKPYIGTIAMTPVSQQKITEKYDNYKYIFRLCLNAKYMVEYLTKTIEFTGKEFGYKKAYIVVQDVLWAKGAGGGVEKWLKENGWEVVGLDAYPTGSSDFSSTLSKAKAGGAQVIVPIFDMPQSGILLKQARAMKVPALVVGSVGPAVSQSSWKTYEGEVEGLVNLQMEIGPLPLKAVPKSVQFNENYAKKYGQETADKLSGHGPGPSYDSVYVLADAIERAGSLDPDAIVKALETTDMEGCIGRIKFGNDHQAIYGTDPKETAVGASYQWKSPGVRVPVFPDVAAEGKIELPPFMKN